MKITHTKSPWLVQIDDDRNDSSLTTIKVIDGSKESLSHPQGALTLANVQSFAPHIKEGIANARLIASAPDLLDALKGAVGYVEMEGGYLNDPYWYTDAKCAIAKAEGKA
jgi:hypothetical protein